MAREPARSGGARGEEAAGRHLEKCGYRILVRNYRGPRYEVDIVAEEKGVLAFVEVKTRRPGEDESGLLAVGPAKQHRIRRAAEHYLLTHPEARSAFCRFDVVIVEAGPGGEARPLRLLRDAFR
ncbi:MAG: YraN family protein [Candidatus Tectomicrobia bacterium RIFCSPLOWO2_02_FULL_70_19]|nr:MAG: YraN family protein [Candidatus Tectomicrobia bacterium RIFCSPLOWO2_02_FULL_70_19]